MILSVFKLRFGQPLEVRCRFLRNEAAQFVFDLVCLKLDIASGVLNLQGKRQEVVEILPRKRYRGRVPIGGKLRHKELQVFKVLLQYFEGLPEFFLEAVGCWLGWQCRVVHLSPLNIRIAEANDDYRSFSPQASLLPHLLAL